jgi:membrane-associated phospholipid phosphatase
MVVSIAIIDQPLALWIESHLQILREPLKTTMRGIEFGIGYYVSKYLIGYITIAIGAILYIKKKNFAAAQPWLFIGGTHIAARLIANVLKDIFLRPRPFEFIKDPSLAHFFTAGNSFPSGHVVHFFSLYFPFAILFPKYKYPLLIIPAFILAQRIIVIDHYISDVLASIIVAYLSALAMKRVLKIQ